MSLFTSAQSTSYVSLNTQRVHTACERALESIAEDRKVKRDEEVLKATVAEMNTRNWWRKIFRRKPWTLEEALAAKIGNPGPDTWFMLYGRQETTIKQLHALSKYSKEPTMLVSGHDFDSIHSWYGGTFDSH